MPGTNVSSWAESIRTSAGGRFITGLSGIRFGTPVFALFACFITTAAAGTGQTLAQDLHGLETLMSGGGVGPFSSSFDLIYLSLVIGAVSAAMISAIWMIRERARTAQRADELRIDLAQAQTDISRYEALISENDRCYVIWDGDSPPHVLGSLSSHVGALHSDSDLLAFGKWLDPKSAADMDEAVDKLRSRAKVFECSVETRDGEMLEIQGRTLGGRAFIRFCVLADLQAELAAMESECSRLTARSESLQVLMDNLETPIWLRDSEDRMVWVNQAYAAAVEATDSREAVEKNIELLGTQARHNIASRTTFDRPFVGRVSTVVRGNRTFFDITEARTASGAAGYAADITETEAVREELRRTIDSHAETLNLLTTPVAMFDGHQCLQFYNQAFQDLWGLDTLFLKNRPTNSELLEKLRTDGRLPEQPSWRDWKEETLSVYRSVDPEPRLWHLADGQTLNVFANIHPGGGVTWVFENLTEKYDLESRYNTLVKVQGETIDHLAEGVAVFGADGRLRLSNPAFRALWTIPEKSAAAGVHVREIAGICNPSHEGPDGWPFFTSIITGYDEERRTHQGRLTLNSGLILDYAVVPLPDAQIMLAFLNVTDNAMVEKALTEKNDALRKADALKNDFVQHVSYELRSPLTNIIGFTDLLKTPQVGDLNERQAEYVEHISTSSSLLLTIVNDILDLATVDAGIMELNMTSVDVIQLAEEVGELFANRLKEDDISLRINAPDSIGRIVADEQRLKQILLKLLGNAANHAPAGSEIDLACSREGADIIFAVSDTGAGIPDDVLQTIFKRFESHAPDGRRNGAGLGLSIVDSFVRLHNGRVDVRTSQGKGTTVICRLPANAEIQADAAE